MIVTASQALADNPGHGVCLSRLLFDYFEPGVVRLPEGFRKVYPLGRDRDGRTIEGRGPGTSAYVEIATAKRIATYREWMEGKGWLQIEDIHISVKSLGNSVAPDKNSIRMRLAMLVESGHVIRREEGRKVFYMWDDEPC